jgi:mannose-6-phosphate isomerase-like protein (cupin superfamily)
VTLTLAELECVAANLAASPERWRHLVRHTDGARVYEQLWEDEQLNAWIICWSEDSDTGFHDHDDSAAAISVVSGWVREERLTVGAPARGREIGPGETFSLPPVAIHRVLHGGGEPAVTIHVYSPPLTRTGAYRIGPEGELERESLPYEAELRAEPALG